MFFRNIRSRYGESSFGFPFFCVVLFALVGVAGCSVTTQAGSSQAGMAQAGSEEAAFPNDQVDAGGEGVARSPEGNAAILQSIASAEVVYLAENHDSVADHAAQLEIIQAMADQGEIAIALEMFQRPFQDQLEAYIAGTITEAELVTNSEYETRWGFDWALYAPIVRYAQANQIPLIALNTPAEITRKVAREGLASLKGDDLNYIPPLDDVDLSNEAHRAWVSDVFNAHGGAGHSLNFENFYAAQVLWDETMAEQVAKQLTTDPGRSVIVLAGEGHVVYGHGIPSRVARRLPEVAQASVQLLPADRAVEAAAADFFWTTVE